MNNYVVQKVAEKRKRLEKLEDQLFDLHHQVGLLTAELAAYEDVLANDDDDDVESRRQRPNLNQPSHLRSGLKKLILKLDTGLDF
jgi:hypothetical protein